MSPVATAAIAIRPNRRKRCLAALGRLAERRKAPEAIRAVAEIPPHELVAMGTDPQVFGGPGEVGGAVSVREELGDHVHALARDVVVVADVVSRLRPVGRDHSLTPGGGGT
jgi:hypothetical protein